MRRFASSFSRPAQRHQLFEGDHALVASDVGKDVLPLGFLPSCIRIALTEHESEHRFVECPALPGGPPLVPLPALEAVEKGRPEPHAQDELENAHHKVHAAQTPTAAVASAAPIVAVGHAGGEGGDDGEQREGDERDEVAHEHRHDPDLEEEGEDARGSPREILPEPARRRTESAQRAAHPVREVIEELPDSVTFSRPAYSSRVALAACSTWYFGRPVPAIMSATVDSALRVFRNETSFSSTLGNGKS